MDAARSSETLVSHHVIKQCHNNPEDRDLIKCLRKNRTQNSFVWRMSGSARTKPRKCSNATDCQLLQGVSWSVAYPVTLTFLLPNKQTTPWSIVPPEKLTVTQRVEKFRFIYVNRRFIIVFIGACPSLSHMNSVHSFPVYFSKEYSNNKFPAVTKPYLQVSRLKFCKYFSNLHACYMPCPSHPSSFDHTNNSLWSCILKPHVPSFSLQKYSRLQPLHKYLQYM